MSDISDSEVLKDVYMYQNPDVSETLEEMFNNEEYSDTLFLINKSQFHASSHLVSASCKVLASELKIHFKNCGDREIRIGSIKHDSSFSLILKCIYGLKIVFDDLETSVLCETLSLSERFEIANLSEELKCFISHIEFYEIGSVVPLLNTAKKFQLEELYEKLTVFAFQNADQVVKHETFGDLNYDVLLELIKSNFFAALEVDILGSVLNWHSINIKDCASDSKIMPEIRENVQNNVEGIEVKEKESENMVLKKELEHSTSDATCTTVEIGHSKELQTFSQNIIISLLSHIRFHVISAVQMYKFSKTQIYTKYKDFLQDFKYSSLNSECRKKFSVPKAVVPPEPPHLLFIPCTSHIFFVPCDLGWGREFESVNEFSSGDVNLKISFKYEGGMFNKRYLNVYLKCFSNVFSTWECKFNCQVKLISSEVKEEEEDNSPTLFIPKEGQFTLISLTSNEHCACVGEFEYEYSSRYYYHTEPSPPTFCVFFTFEVFFEKP